MAKYEEEHSGSAFKELMIAIPGVIIGFTLLISLIAYLLNGASSEPEEASAVEVAKVEENIAPVAEVAVASEAAADAVDSAVVAAAADGEAAPQAERSGEEVVKAVCAMCHATGMMESPKIGDAGQWEARIAQGYDVLVKNAIDGINMMPPRGGNPGLTDGEVAAAVAHMVNQSGGDFNP